jgi:hypothetical protein
LSFEVKKATDERCERQIRLFLTLLYTKAQTEEDEIITVKSFESASRTDEIVTE